MHTTLQEGQGAPQCVLPRLQECISEALLDRPHHVIYVMLMLIMTLFGDACLYDLVANIDVL